MSGKIYEGKWAGESNEWAWMSAVAGLALGLSACGGTNTGAAWVACKNAVKAQLENPATADFALTKTTIEETVIDGVLTAKNDFGVEQELQFNCKISGDAVTNVEVLPTR